MNLLRNYQEDFKEEEILRGSTLEQWKDFLLLNEKYLLNTCNGNSELIIHGTENKILGRVIQGGPLSMQLYALTTLPLIKTLSPKINIIQCWYADDSSAQGRFEDWIRLNNEGLFYGYHSLFYRFKIMF